MGKQYEYTYAFLETNKASDRIQELNNFGREGWRVIKAANATTFLMEREITPETGAA